MGNLQTLILLLAQEHICFSVFEIHHTEETSAFTSPSFSSFTFSQFPVMLLSLLKLSIHVHTSLSSVLFL